MASGAKLLGDVRARKLRPASQGLASFAGVGNGQHMLLVVLGGQLLLCLLRHVLQITLLEAREFSLWQRVEGHKMYVGACLKLCRVVSGNA